MMIDLSPRDLELIIEALKTASSRHQSMGHRCKGRFRYRHFANGDRMTELRREIQSKIIEYGEPGGLKA